MPLYEFHCLDCDRDAELLVKGAEEPVCPACGSAKLSRLLSIVAAPARNQSPGRDRFAPPTGPCGASCGCFPQG